MNSIAIIGAGSAGILSASYMISYLPSYWKVYLIHDPSISTLGIGESTNPSFCTTIEKGLDFNFLKDIQELDGTCKFATKFINWRDEDFDNRLIGGSFAIHFDTHKFKDFAIKKLKNLHGGQFNEIQGTVTSLTNSNNYAEVTVNDVVYQFNYVIDCRGFPKDYTDYTLSNLPLNRCLVHNVKEKGDWQYTGHRATKNGWMFEIPLTTRQSYGYLFNDRITNVNEAIEDFSNEINVSKDLLDNIEYKFKPYYANKIFDGRICKNGNAALFFEPMSANSLWVYFNINSALLHYILGNINTVQEVNDLFTKNALAVEESISYVYHGGSKYDTPFWQDVVRVTTERLKTSKNLKRAIDEFNIANAKGLTPESMSYSWIFSADALLRMDKFFGYKYFRSSK